MNSILPEYLAWVFKPFFAWWWVAFTGTATLVAFVRTPQESALSPTTALLVTFAASVLLFLTASVVMQGWKLYAERERAFEVLHTFASLVLPAKKRIFREQFRMRYAGLLFRVGIPSDVIASELRAAQQISTAPSSSRQVLGVLNEAAHTYRAHVCRDYELTAEHIEDRLLENMISVNDYEYPMEALERILTEDP